MTTTTPPARPAAQALRATYRADGIVLLELIEDWSTALGRAEVPADDDRQLRGVLTGWALRPTDQTKPSSTSTHPLSVMTWA